MFITSNHLHDTNELKTKLGKEFDIMDLGDEKKILEIEIHRDRGANKLLFYQKSYVENVLRRFDMSKAKHVSTPLENNFNLSLEQCSKTDSEIEGMSKILYANAVGCLMHNMVCTRLDLAQAFSQMYMPSNIFSLITLTNSLLNLVILVGITSSCHEDPF